MKYNREAILTYLVYVVFLGLAYYNNWTKSTKIQELENVIQTHRMYSTEDELRINYKKKNILRTKRYRTLNDSLSISFLPDILTEENYGTLLHFNVTAVNKLDKKIKSINGTLTLRDSSQIIVIFPIEIRPELLPNTGVKYWRQSWNLERYVPAIKESLKHYDITSLTTEWRTISILFEDNSAILLNENIN